MFSLRVSEIGLLPLLCVITPFSPPHLYSLPQISRCSPGSIGRWPLGYEERRCWANCPCYYEFPRFPTDAVLIHQCHRQTDGQTDDMQSQDRGLHYSASRGKNKTRAALSQGETRDAAVNLDTYRILQRQCIVRFLCHITAFLYLYRPTSATVQNRLSLPYISRN